MDRPVTYLRIDEPARFNPERLEHLCAELGEARAETKVADALETIGALVRQIECLDPFQDWGALKEPLEALIKASDLIGMATLARVARDVLGCMERNDAVALASTLSRLHRVGERSILAIWDLEDLSG